jgi:hypothetical protein
MNFKIFSIRTKKRVAAGRYSIFALAINCDLFILLGYLITTYFADQHWSLKLWLVLDATR